MFLHKMPCHGKVLIQKECHFLVKRNSTTMIFNEIECTKFITSGIFERVIDVYRDISIASGEQGLRFAQPAGLIPGTRIEMLQISFGCISYVTSRDPIWCDELSWATLSHLNWNASQSVLWVQIAAHSNLLLWERVHDYKMTQLDLGQVQLRFVPRLQEYRFLTPSGDGARVHAT